MILKRPSAIRQAAAPLSNVTTSSRNTNLELATLPLFWVSVLEQVGTLFTVFYNNVANF
jgi:hypothetical protein